MPASFVNVLRSGDLDLIRTRRAIALLRFQQVAGRREWARDAPAREDAGAIQLEDPLESNGKRFVLFF